MSSEPECNGVCLSPGDIGLPEYDGPDVIAYAHPDCPRHGDPVPEREADTCGGGDESLRYVREEDVEPGAVR